MASGSWNGAFAVWPEDNERDARRECLQHALDQPWRLSESAVVQEFTDEVLGFGDPGLTDAERADREAMTLLGTTRLGPCWYVTHTSPREGYAHINVGTRWEGEDLVAVVDWAGHGAADVEIGFDGEVQRRETAGASAPEFRFEDVDGPGHYVVRYGAGSSGGETYAGRLPRPPAAPTTELVRAPESEVRPVRGRGNRACGRRFSLGFRWSDDPRQSLDRLMTELRLKHVRLPRPPRFTRHGDDWIAEVDRARLRVDMDRVGRCYRVLAVEPATGDDLGLRPAMSRGLISFSFDWQGADQAYVQASDSFYYLRKTELPLTFPASVENLPTPDYVLLVLHRRNRFHSAIGYEVAPG
jgi:hypothetical protein